MASTGQSKGNEILVYVDGTAVGYARGGTLNINNDMLDATSKNSAGWKDTLPGLRSWTVEGDGLHLYDDATTGFSDLFALIDAKTQVSLKFTTAVSGDKYYTGNAYVTSISLETPNEDVSTFSFSFEGDGALAEVTLT